MRFTHKTERTCRRCDLVRVTRHEAMGCWTEFWRGLERVDANLSGRSRTPACEPVEESAHA